ncbi:hypothetical protein BH160DRAFT_3780 [Burkholderia sp. H160]|nr:hypothetical protein BH160DRAFT_3780 [Burkholderia sp. H160]
MSFKPIDYCRTLSDVNLRRLRSRTAFAAMAAAALLSGCGVFCGGAAASGGAYAGGCGTSVRF